LKILYSPSQNYVLPQQNYENFNIFEKYIICVKATKALEQLLSTWLVAPRVEIESGH
jgi:hypothetical protein